jgi:hypothetical protein
MSAYLRATDREEVAALRDVFANTFVLTRKFIMIPEKYYDQVLYLI